MKKFLAIGILALGMVCVSCDDTPTTNTPNTTTLPTTKKDNLMPLQADGWLYYSFDKDTVIDASKADGADWDVKFRYTRFDTSKAGIGNFISIYTVTGPMFFNSGTVNNNGQTQAALVDVPFDSVADASKYTLKNDDTSASARICPLLTSPSTIFIYSGPPKHAVSTNPNKSFVVKTKSNKYVKFQLLSIYKNAPDNPDITTETNYFTIRYVKGDGTRLR